MWKGWNPFAFSYVFGLSASFSRVVLLCSREPWPGLRERSLFSWSRESEAIGNFKSPEKGLGEMDVSSAAETRELSLLRLLTSFQNLKCSRYHRSKNCGDQTLWYNLGLD